MSQNGVRAVVVKASGCGSKPRKARMPFGFMLRG